MERLPNESEILTYHNGDSDEAIELFSIDARCHEWVGGLAFRFLQGELFMRNRPITEA